MPLIVAGEAVWLANDAAATRVGDPKFQHTVIRPAWDAFIVRSAELGAGTLRAPKTLILVRWTNGEQAHYLGYEPRKTST